KCMQVVLYLICLPFTLLFVKRSPSSRSSPPYSIRSSKPFTARISFFQADELCPFHDGVVGVIKFKKALLNPLAFNLLFLKDAFIPFFINHFTSKQVPERMSFFEISFDKFIGNL